MGLRDQQEPPMFVNNSMTLGGWALHVSSL